ncbi:dynamin family protein [Liquorilactobacillus mali]|uniref:XRE family transcriptional regulator n=1 Tax=Liquorilactobacillus mali KCTC 3596 = DSM 20444 TaxID=1046596 RepID=J0L7Z2_9LACO|nr:dynamin family protein [Liquorilactobacillus mali]EJF01633.1 XRE family transcriptional regulator [Liquorilactobacillus mali KCTC 3596 = DSM 20444]KRN09098.1 XRE family transcriptional regulator [Liquorilactobacillus mali KCTC 3596 = DSM 20444]QFQ74408.1 XRE family transcriptional regulator [Liquorilactobacillus mali]
MNGEFDLNYFREKILKMNKQDFADLMEIDVITLEMWEGDPDNLTMRIYKEIAEKTDYTLEQLFNFKEHVPLPWKLDNKITEKREKVLKKVLENEQSFEEALLEIEQKELEEGFEINVAEVKGYFEELKKIGPLCSNRLRKPLVAFIGASDAGKSSLINVILGTDLLPMAFQPMTAAINYVYHELDKPENIGDENNTVVVRTNHEQLVDISNLENIIETGEHVIAIGRTNLIREYGLNKYNEEINEENNQGLTYIFTFIDAPILTGLAFIDTPGISANEKDNQTALKAYQYADVTIYLSQMSSFLREEDMIFIKQIIDSSSREFDQDGRVPFNNLLFVGSHADSVGNSDISEIFNRAVARFLNVQTSTYFAKFGPTYNQETFRKRFYASDIKDPRLSQPFKQAFIAMMENILSVKIRQSRLVQKKAIEEMIKTGKKIEEHLTARINFPATKESLKKYKFQQIEEELLRLSNTKKEVSIRDFHNAYAKIFTINSIEGLIKKKEFKNNQEDKKKILLLLQNMVDEKLQAILKENSDDFSSKMDGSIKKFNDFFNSENFDFTNFFIKSSTDVATSLGIYGAFSILFGSLGNLGGYLLFMQTAGFLSSVGLYGGTVSGTATAISAIGGPLTLGLALIIFSGLVVFNIFGDGWMRKYAKQLVKQFEKLGVEQKYSMEIIRYWDDTAKITAEAIKKVEEEYAQHQKETAQIIQAEIPFLRDLVQLVESVKVAEDEKIL